MGGTSKGATLAVSVGGLGMGAVCAVPFSPEPRARCRLRLRGRTLCAAGLVWHTLPRLRARGHADGKVAAGV